MGIFDKIGEGLRATRDGLDDAGDFIKDHVVALGDDICPNIPDPYMEKNVCSTVLEEIYESQYSCSNVSTHVTAAKDFCDQFGALGEWDYENFVASITTPCQVSLTHPFSKGKFPCLQSVGVGLGVAALSAVGIGVTIVGDVISGGLLTPIGIAADAALTGAAVGAFAGTGVGVKCRRKKFTGDPLKCCLKDNVCTGQCFQDNSVKKPLHTCPLENRDAGASECQEILKNYCLGVDNADPQVFQDRWTTIKSLSYDTDVPDPNNSGQFIQETISFDTPICQAMLYRNVYKDSIGCSYQSLNGIIPDTQGFEWGKDLVSETFKRYLLQNGNLLTPSPMLDTLENICRQNPGLCDPYLKSYCRNFPTESLNGNPFLSKWCGCHLNEDHYDQYLDQFGISKACTPMCHLPGTIPTVGDDGFHVLKCDQQVCMIDNLTIDAIKSKIGDVNLTDICSGCIDCQCTIVDNTIIELGTKVGKLSIVNQCAASSIGNGPKCVTGGDLNADSGDKNTVGDKKGKSVSFDCHSKLPTAPNVTSSSSTAVASNNNTTALAYIVLTIAVIAFIIAAALLVRI
jgi:hypothetical protein